MRKSLIIPFLFYLSNVFCVYTIHTGLSGDIVKTIDCYEQMCGYDILLTLGKQGSLVVGNDKVNMAEPLPYSTYRLVEHRVPRQTLIELNKHKLLCFTAPNELEEAFNVKYKDFECKCRERQDSQAWTTRVLYREYREISEHIHMNYKEFEECPSTLVPVIFAYMFVVDHFDTFQYDARTGEIIAILEYKDKPGSLKEEAPRGFCTDKETVALYKECMEFLHKNGLLTSEECASCINFLES